MIIGSNPIRCSKIFIRKKMKTMIYYISDTHFGHKNIINYEHRPFKCVEEMNETLIYNWNKKVKPEDDIYILGDFSSYSATNENNIKILKRLNGKKHLVLGNHDSFARKPSFDKTLFESINDYREINDNGRHVCLFHYPIAVYDRQHYGSYHCYGHVHSKMHLVPEQLRKSGRAFNVGVDVNNYEPVTLDELIERYNNQN